MSKSLGLGRCIGSETRLSPILSLYLKPTPGRDCSDFEAIAAGLGYRPIDSSGRAQINTFFDSVFSLSTKGP